MKILIFLFAMITFILMSSDPRRDDLETRDTTLKPDQNKESVKKQEEKEQEDLDESS
ncbi:hypothetical protein [Acinetobacter sp. ANC 3832]|uniref:ABZJ_00068 family colistin stress protein n=1 Tax=Acinetobacter sp. ANC 3832 TaxID=1977874 RepID=UPI00148A2B3F|nr:hypothetical protein [Acinetobacter sp. ANC 3832]